MIRIKTWCFFIVSLLAFVGCTNHKDQSSKFEHPGRIFLNLKLGGAGRQVLPFLLSDHQLLVQGGVSMEKVMKRCLLSYLALLGSQNQGGGYMEETEDEEFLLSLRKMM